MSRFVGVRITQALTVRCRQTFVTFPPKKWLKTRGLSEGVFFLWLRKPLSGFLTIVTLRPHSVKLGRIWIFVLFGSATERICTPRVWSHKG